MVINANLESINVFSLALSAAREAASFVSGAWDPSEGVNVLGFCFARWIFCCCMDFFFSWLSVSVKID